MGVKPPTLLEWLDDVRYLARHLEAGPEDVHDHMECAWRPYQEAGCASGYSVRKAGGWPVRDPVTRNRIRGEMLDALTYRLAWRDHEVGHQPRIFELVVRAFHRNADVSQDPFVAAMAEVRAIERELGIRQN